MHQSRWVLCATLLFASTSIEAQPVSSKLDVRLLRVEGAAAGVRMSAERLSDIAEKVSNSGTLSNLAQINNELTDLHRMVIGVRMATDMAIKEMRANTPAD